MDETNKKNVYEQINELAVKYSDSDTAQKTKYFDELFTLFYTNIIAQKEKMEQNYIKDDIHDMCVDLFFELIEKYDAAKNNNFCNYYNSIYNARKKNTYKDSSKIQLNDDNTSSKEDYESKSIELEVEEKNMIIFLIIVEKILMNKAMNTDAETSESRMTYSQWDYFYKFHTDMVVGYVKDLTSADNLKKYNGRIMDSIEYSFLCYIMTENCRNILDIQNKDCKFKLSKKASALIRLPQLVYTDYMNIDKGSVSKMVSKYRTYLQSILKESI